MKVLMRQLVVKEPMVMVRLLPIILFDECTYSQSTSHTWLVVV